MPKHRTSFNVSIITEDKVGAATLAKEVRKVLSGLNLYLGVEGKRVKVGVVKVTVSNVGEK